MVVVRLLPPVDRLCGAEHRRCRRCLEGIFTRPRSAFFTNPVVVVVVVVMMLLVVVMVLLAAAALLIVCDSILVTPQRTTVWGILGG